jgi:uncharacterized membrane protein required for colicin V production
MSLVPNSFDIVVLALLIWGLVRGRKFGMSGELLPLLQWAVIVVVGAYANDPLGRQLKAVLPLGLPACKALAYVGIAVVAVTATSLLKAKMGEKLVSKDLFGSGEFYLGMGAGMVHHALIIVAGLALLNAASYSKAQLDAATKKAEADFGSDFFGWAHPARIQRTAFRESIIGPQIRTHLGHLLVHSSAPPQVAATETRSQQTSRALNDIIGK